MPPQTAQLDLSKYSPEQQQSIRQQLELALKAGSLNPAQQASVSSLLKSFGDPARSIPTSELREPEPSVLGTAEREGAAFLKSFPQAITGAYEAATAPRTKEEAKEFPSALDYPALLYERLLHGPATTAEDFYTAAAKGQVPNAYEQILTAAPEALGQGAAAPVIGRLASTRSLGAITDPASVLGRLLRASGRTALSAAEDVPGLRKLGEFGRNYAATKDISADMQKLTEQAIAERRANPVKTRIKPEKAAPAPKKVTPPPIKGFKGPADIEAARAAEAEAEGIKGSLPAGKGRMVLTPEEVKQLENFYKLNKRSAHERGMAFAGGRVPAEGRSVPRIPRPQTTVEWRGLKGAEAEAAIMDVLKKLAGGL